jgi:adhesin transport system outer membrane protein
MTQHPESFSAHRATLLLSTALLLGSSLWLELASADAVPVDPPVHMYLTDDVWSLERLAVETLATYPSVMGQLREVDAARADFDAARWQRYPSPELQLSRDDTGESNVIVALQQPLWTGGRIQAGIRAAEARLGAAGHGVGEARQELLLRLAESYTEAARRQAQQRVHTENVAQHERLVEMIERRVAQAFSPAVDLSLANSRLAQAASDLSAVNQALNAALQQLSELAGQPVLAVQEAFKETHLAPSSLREAEDQTLIHSPALAALLREREAAEQDARSERARLSPVVALRLEHRDLGAQNRSDQRALIVLESQLGAGLSSLASVNAAAARREAVEQRRLTAERQLRTEVALAWQQWLGSRVRAQSAAQNRDGTRHVFESYARQYAIGQKSWLDLLNSVREDTLAALAVEDASFEMRLALLRLALLTGRLEQANPAFGATVTINNDERSTVRGMRAWQIRQ